MGRILNGWKTFGRIHSFSPTQKENACSYRIVFIVLRKVDTRGDRVNELESGSVASLIRTFAAVPVAAPAAVAALAAVQAALRRAPGRVRWVAPAQFHFTLKFLGDLPPERVAVARAALQQAAAAATPFTLAIAGVGAFPLVEAARVLWAGCGAGSAELAALAAQAEAELVAAGFPPSAASPLTALPRP